MKISIKWGLHITYHFYNLLVSILFIILSKFAYDDTLINSGDYEYILRNWSSDIIIDFKFASTGEIC